MNVPLPIDVSNNNLNLNSWTINLNEVVDYINSLNTLTGTGPNGIQPMFLKSCCSVLTQPLHFIFNEPLSLRLFSLYLQKIFCNSSS